MANNMQYGYGNPNQMPMNNYQQSYNGPYSTVRNVSTQDIQLQNANMTIVFDGVHQ